MNYFITGGAGFIGSNFVRMLLNGQIGQATSVTVLDKLTYAGSLTNLEAISEDSRFKFVYGDICDEVLVRKHLGKDMVVVHFAAESHVDRSIAGSYEFVRTNVVGTQNLLQQAMEVGVSIFLHVSTDEVYGSVEAGDSVETDSLLPNSPYAASKAASDLLARSYFKTHNLDVRITRCCNNYGPYQYPEKLIPLFVTNLLLGFPIPVYGTGKNVREWIHVDDHCRAIQLVIDGGLPGEIYNIGSDIRLENIEIAQRLIKEMSKDLDQITYVEDRKGHDLRYALNSSKIKNALSFQPSRKFDEGLRDVVKWFEGNPFWWQEKVKR